MFNISELLNLVKGGLLNPAETWKSYLSSNHNWQYTAINLTVPLIVVTAILTAIFGWMFSSYSMFGVYMGVWGTIKYIILSLVSLAVVSYIFAFLAKVFGGKNDFSKAFAALSLTAIPSAIGGVLGTLPMVGALLSLAFGILGLVYLYKIIPIYLEVPEAKRAVHFVVSLLASIVFMIVIGATLNLGNNANDYKINNSAMFSDIINKK